MKLTILVDNTTTAQNLKAEAGLSIYIEDTETKVLFDLGESSLFLENAQKLGINLFDLNYIVLSHGHHDHSWGLNHLLPFYEQANTKKTTILAHPLAFQSRIKENKEIGLNIPVEKLNNAFLIQKSTSPIWINDRLVFLGDIERRYKYEGMHSIGTITTNGRVEADYMQDDTALAYKSNQGLIIITGCSHSGIGNIVEQAKEVCKDTRVHTIIGGLHLCKPSYEQLNGTLEYLDKTNVHALYACHCTDLSSRIFLSKLGNIQEVSVGLTLEFLA
ncbi:MBL fold metallo-hydrolase [Dendrosporobacter sp. 1207_IL3150]|uniref:MBL fold metallo-hydrolase n=1 Tax=Dendrosporobacter sp. 1207_IL3150 TaxID=3084054 RepID=UPI002FDA48DF